MFMPVISLSIDPNLLKKFEQIIERDGYSSKSEAFRVAIRDFIMKYDSFEFYPDAQIEMIVSFSYVDTIRLRNSILSVEHEYIQNIKETLHRHGSDKLCFELLILHGKFSKLQDLLKKLRAINGILTFTINSLGSIN